MRTSHLATPTLPSEPGNYEEYDGDGFRLLGLLWHRKYFVAAFCAVGLLVAGLVAIFMANQYTSEVVIQARLTQQDPQDPQLLSDIFPDAASAASIIQTEVNLIGSGDIAERVVTRFDLAKDPNFAESLLDRAFDSITTFLRSGPASPNSSPNRLIAAKLLKNLEVRNEARSMLIRISYTSTSPEQSARIANAFAEEYLRTRIESAARRRLSDLSVTYGPKHPSVLKAQFDLEKVLTAPSMSQRVQILSWASPPVLPSGPDRKLIVAVAFLGSFAAGIVWVLLLERANTSFRSTAELATEAKAPCLGIFTEGSERHSLETARAIVMAGLGTQSPQPKILLVTCSVPEEGEFLVSTAIARSLVQMGRRALILDLLQKAPETSKSRSLEGVLDDLEHHPLQLDEQLTMLCSSSGSCENQSTITSRSFLQFLEQAREQCDLVIIRTPPVMISADALYLGRHADFVLHVVRWNSTPRSAVVAGLERLRNFGTAIDGVILSGVDEREYRRLTGVEPEQSRRKNSWIRRTPKSGRFLDVARVH